jgi:AbiV family abortive infection protein
MATYLSSEYLMRGAWYALEQAGLLLHDAVTLFDAGRYSTAVGLAMLGREELGKSRILTKLWRERKSVTFLELRKLFEDHEEKQRAAQLHISVSAPKGSALAEIMKSAWSDPPTPESRAAQVELERAMTAKAKRTPGNRHLTRMKALYVDPDDSGSKWQLPKELSKDEAEELVLGSMNDCSAQRMRIQMDHHDDLSDTLRNWRDRPELPMQVWPK